MICVYTCVFRSHMSNVDYYKTLKAIRAVAGIHGGRDGFHEVMFKEKLKKIKK